MPDFYLLEILPTARRGMSSPPLPTVPVTLSSALFSIRLNWLLVEIALVYVSRTVANGGTYAVRIDFY
jgi:hypothetical protein